MAEYIKFLRNWDVIDLVELCDAISKGDSKHAVNHEFTYLAQVRQNGSGFLYDLDDWAVPVINDYLITNFGYKKGERILFWLSW